MCFMLAAGKKITVDGAVMIGRSCDTISTMASHVIHRDAQDNEVPSILHIPSTLPGKTGIDIPQVAHTYAYTATVCMRNDWGYPQVLGGVNEKQVFAGASTGGSVSDEVEALTPWPETALGDFLMTMVLERCSSAKESIQFLGEMTEKYGARGDIYIVGDKDEAWLFEQYQGYHWAAVRIPDDKFVIMANCFRIGEMDLSDTDNYMAAPDLVSFAEENGLWNPANGPFHASKAYGTRKMPSPRNYPTGYTGSSLRSFGNQIRVWGGIKTLAPSADIDIDIEVGTEEDYALFWSPDTKLDMENFLAVLKCCYKDTKFDEYGLAGEKFESAFIDQETGHYRYAPAFGKARLIGCPNQSTTYVCKINENLPENIRATFWAGIGPGTSSPHVPYYALSAKIPAVYQKGEWRESNAYEKDSAYWLYTNIGNIRNLFYQPLHKMVSDTWEGFESRAVKAHNIMEEHIMNTPELDMEELKEMLSDFSYRLSLEAYETGEELMGNMFTRIALLNNPHTVLQFQDPETWKLYGMVH